MVLKKNNWVLILVIFLFFTVTLPLFLFQFRQEAFLSFALLLLYIWIDLHINLLYKLGSRFKLSKMAVIFLSFFGLKNAFFFTMYLLFLKQGLLTHSSLYIIMALFYLLFSIAIGKKVLNKPYSEV